MSLSPSRWDASRSRWTCRSAIRLISRLCGFRKAKQFAHITLTRLNRNFTSFCQAGAAFATKMVLPK